MSIRGYLGAFASLADVAKGGDGAESALREFCLPLLFFLRSLRSFAACRAVGFAGGLFSEFWAQKQGSRLYNIILCR